jgi:predicted dehydrogenase
MIASIVGAGGAGLLHALSLRAAGVSVAHVYDPDVERAVSLAGLVGGARVHPHLDSLVEAGSDVVSICSPPRAHVLQATRCSTTARLVLVEKPVALSVAELACLEALPRCVPVVQWRLGRGLRAVRRAVRAGIFGDCPTVAVDMTLHRGEAYFDGERRELAAWGCGALLSVGIHAIDAIGHALGSEVVSAVAFRAGAAGSDDEVAERGAVVALRYPAAVATLRITFEASGAEGDHTRFVVCGRGVTAILEGSEEDPTASAVRWSTGDARVRRRLEAIERGDPRDGDGGPHASAPLLVPYIGRAIEALRAGLQPGTDEALPAVTSVAAAHRAAFP